MGKRKTGIEWTDETWNPWAGCQIVSEACANCYAMTDAYRQEFILGRDKYQGLSKITPTGQKLWTGEIRFWPKALDKVSPGQAPKMIFVNSMSDVYHEGVKLDDLKRVFERMNLCENHTFQILTKRPERMLEVADKLVWTPNIWQGVTCESSAYVGRVNLLRTHPAATRFVSAEPLLDDLAPTLDLTGIHWLIAGGETGKVPSKVRRMRPEWAWSLKMACERAGTAYFLKQWGNWSETNAWRDRPLKSETLGGVLYHQFPFDLEDAA